MGSPTMTLAGAAPACSSNFPIQPLNAVGRPSAGRSNTCKFGRPEGIAKVSNTGPPPNAPEKSPPPKKSSNISRRRDCPGRGDVNVTVAAGSLMLPASRGMSSFWNRSTVYRRPSSCPAEVRPFARRSPNWISTSSFDLWPEAVAGGSTISNRRSSSTGIANEYSLTSRAKYHSTVRVTAWPT